MDTKKGIERRLRILQANLPYQYLSYIPCGNNSYFKDNNVNGYIDAYINMSKSPIFIERKLLK